ncbi:carbon catabolite repressor protein 4 homolog 3 isoform X3 [Ziziphus jujuba]|uniref:Carbon catabolite repressor protein 4 homolog 3 isoform X3 n=1 Tax=Ziziphus jujuba TaxID=326968 RepID=A0A6P6G7C0_ZIZJJ|nr:carbon catabolite repressor protein 4 homolog 3 isoform X3 [Ziziphus jujuba]
MRCEACSSSSLCARYGPVSTTAPSRSSLKSRPSFFYFFNCKPSISCSTNRPTDSSSSSSSLSTSSYSRRWYNPLRRRQLDEAPDIERHWVEADQPPLASLERFTVASYNILADRNASWHKDLYSNVPYSYMNWDRRKRLICKELIGWNPDIICLQEVDKYFDLSDMLATAGYLGSYKMCNAASRRLLIGNIHVLYNPRRGHVKLGQIRSLFSRAQNLSEKWGNAPAVLAGDFNSTPQSAIYKFLSSSELNVMLYDRRELSGQRSCHPAQVLGLKQQFSSPLKSIDGLLKDCWTDEEIKVATGKTTCNIAVHPLKLNSSYATVRGSLGTRGSNGEPLATSYHSKFLGTVDYLWHSDCLVPTKVLDTISIDVLQRTGGLPCKDIGSDHLALVSEFAFTTPTNVGINAAT